MQQVARTEPRLVGRMSARPENGLTYGVALAESFSDTYETPCIDFENVVPMQTAIFICSGICQWTIVSQKVTLSSVSIWTI